MIYDDDDDDDDDDNDDDNVNHLGSLKKMRDGAISVSGHV